MKLKKKIISLFIVSLFGSAIATPPPVITWQLLSQLNNHTGSIPKEIQQVTQKDIQIAGFIVPLELGEDMEKVSEFILVPNPLACIHIPPPPPNQMIYVKMKQQIPLDMDLRGIYVTGKLSIPLPKAKDGYFSYEMIGKSAKKANIEFEDPLLDLLSR